VLASQLGWEFADGDNFIRRPTSRKWRTAYRSMTTTASRGSMPFVKPWNNGTRNATMFVLACSALKKSYRERLQINSGVKVVYLKGTYDLLRKRLHSRKGHYATEQLLTSQFADLEEPADAITIDVAHSPEEIVAEIRRQLTLA